jgi:beta-ribofuranosylaminobenzene 5'-phosphate synthase
LLLEGFQSLDEQTAKDLYRLVRDLVALPGARPFRVRLKATPPQHVGFGSKTTLLLSVASGADAILGLKLDRNTIQQLSGRGGASGIGIHAFFCGGVLWDAGHPTSHTQRLAPSSAAEGHAMPPLMLRLPFPEEWKVALILPNCVGASGQGEKQFFERHLPTTRASALSTMAILYHGVLPAFAMHDLNALKAALMELHNIGFKAVEVDAHAVAARSVLGALHEQKLCAGMSSMGPLIYVVVPSSDNTAHEMAERICNHYQATWMGLTSGFNMGASIGETTS